MLAARTLVSDTLSDPTIQSKLPLPGTSRYARFVELSEKNARLVKELDRTYSNGNRKKQIINSINNVYKEIKILISNSQEWVTTENQVPSSDLLLSDCEYIRSSTLQSLPPQEASKPPETSAGTNNDTTSVAQVQQDHLTPIETETQTLTKPENSWAKYFWYAAATASALAAVWFLGKSFSGANSFFSNAQRPKMCDTNQKPSPQSATKQSQVELAPQSTQVPNANQKPCPQPTTQQKPEDLAQQSTHIPDAGQKPPPKSKTKKHKSIKTVPLVTGWFFLQKKH